MKSEFKKKLITLLVSLLVIFALFINARFYHYQIIGVALFLFYLFLTGREWGIIFSQISVVNKKIRILVGIFVVLVLISFLTALPIFLYKLNFNWIIYGLIFILIIGLALSNQKKILEAPEDAKEEPFFKIKTFWLILSIIIFSCLTIFLFFRGRSDSYLLSPWTRVSPLVFYFIGFLIFLSLILIFSRARIKTTLFIIILVSLVVHSYLLIVYPVGFGGDRWRHIGAEKWLMEGNIYSPSLWGEPTETVNFLGIKLPKVFLVGNKNSYANMWGLTATASWLTSVDVFWVDYFLGFLMWSIFVPILTFLISALIFKKQRISCLAALLSLMFFPFQVYGAITVPNAFGFMVFLLAFFLVLFYLGGPRKSIGLIVALILCFPVLYLNYILYLVLFVILLVFAILFKIYSHSIHKKEKWIIVFVLFCLFLNLIFLFPFLDTVNNYSHFIFDKPIYSLANLRSQLVNFGKNLIISSSIFPRVANMEQDNWLFMQNNETLSRSILFKITRWPYLLTPAILLIALFGFIYAIKFKNKFLILASIFLPALLLGQFIGSHFMNGNHIFTKRLILIISYLFLFLIVGGVNQLLVEKKNQFFSKKFLAACLFLIFSFTTTTVYASGPKMQMVSKGELEAADYLWQKIKPHASPNGNYCVIANTWPLLAIEAASSKYIVAGGFPVYFEYSQPERVQIFNNMNKAPSIKYLKKAMELTNAKDCYFMTEERWIDVRYRQDILKRLYELLGEPERINAVLLWHYTH